MTTLHQLFSTEETWQTRIFRLSGSAGSLQIESRVMPPCSPSRTIMIGYVFQTQCKQATHNANQQIHAPDRRCANRTTQEDMMDDSRLTATCIGTCFSLCKINSTSYSRAHMIIAATSDASWHLPVMTYHWYEEEERKGKRGTGERIRG